MKFKGKKPNAGNTVHVVIPRQNGESMLFVANGIFDYSEFNKRYPEPEPPTRVTKGIHKVDFDHPKYKEAFGVWAKLRTEWLILESLKETPDFEWETVNMEDATTWCNYETELNEVLLPSETGKIIEAVMEACSLTPQKIEEATEAFLSGMGPELLNGSCQTTEPSTTQSSEPVSDSE